MDKKQSPIQVVPKDAVVFLQSDIKELSITNRVHLKTIQNAVTNLYIKREEAEEAAA